MLFDFLHVKEMDVRILQSFLFSTGIYIIKGFNDYAKTLTQLHNDDSTVKKLINAEHV